METDDYTPQVKFEQAISIFIEKYPTKPLEPITAKTPASNFPDIQHTGITLTSFIKSASESKTVELTAQHVSELSRDNDENKIQLSREAVKREREWCQSDGVMVLCEEALEVKWYVKDVVFMFWFYGMWPKEFEEGKEVKANAVAEEAANEIESGDGAGRNASG